MRTEARSRDRPRCPPLAGRLTWSSRRPDRPARRRKRRRGCSGRWWSPAWLRVVTSLHPRCSGLPFGSRYLRQELSAIVAPRKPGRRSNTAIRVKYFRLFPWTLWFSRGESWFTTFSGRLLPVLLQPAVDQRDGLIDRRQAHAFLRRDGLHQAVGALDVGRAVRQSPRRGGRGQERECRARVLFERHEVLLG